MDARIGVNENASGGEALGAVTGDGIVVVEVTMLAGVELDRSTIFYAGQCCHPRQSSRSCLARGLRHRDVCRSVVADTRNALTLREAAYPLVQYIPDEDVDFSQLEQTDHVTYCPLQGRLQLLQHSRRRREVRQCGVVIRGSVSCCCADQGIYCVLSRAGR